MWMSLEEIPHCFQLQSELASNPKTNTFNETKDEFCNCYSSRLYKCHLIKLLYSLIFILHIFKMPTSI